MTAIEICWQIIFRRDVSSKIVSSKIVLSIYDLGSSATWVGGNLAILWSLTVKLKHYQSISYSMSQNCQFPTTVTQPRLLCCGVTAMDNQQVTLLALLDLSAAFDCVDRDILLSRLQSSFSLRGITLTGIQSFLTDRTKAWCLVQWEPLGRNYALIWRSTRIFRTLSIFVVCSTELRHYCIIRTVRPQSATPMLMIPSCTSAFRRPNRRRLQPRWLHVEGLDQWMWSNRLKLNA